MQCNIFEQISYSEFILVELIYAQGIDVAAQLICWSWGCPTEAQKQAKKAFLGCFWAYFGQIHNHMGFPQQCPSHQSILLTQEPIYEIFMK